MMKSAILTLILVGIVSCAKKPTASRTHPNANQEKRALAQKVRALDSILAKGDTPETPEAIAPVLTARALQEFSLRLPNAVSKESSLRFSSPGIAVVSVVYTLPESETLRTQTVEFVYTNEQWNMFWKPESASEEPPKKAPMPKV